MKIYFLIFLISTSTIIGQKYEVENIIGNVKFLSSSSNTWQSLKPKMSLNENTVVATDKSSSVKIRYDVISFTLNESSAITLSSIKKISLDELILALAMENIMDTPKNKGIDKSDNTAVYGNKITKDTQITLTSNEFGLKRLNGAKQLAENGMKESAVITSKEVYRKYPDTKKDINSRIYFADLLFELHLYEESLDEYNEIKQLDVSLNQKNHVNGRIEQVSKKLIKY